MAHVLTDFLGTNPMLQAGLSRGFQGWEFCRRLAGNPFLLNSLRSPNLRFFAGDFETATDFLEHGVLLAVWTQFLDLCKLRNPYLLTALSLLLKPRKVFDRSGSGPGRYSAAYESYRGSKESWITTNGVLMGEPGTKPTLTLLGLVCFSALAGENPADLPRATAGDDWGLICDPLVDVPLLRQTALDLSAKFSDDKTDIFRWGMPYCEEAVVRPPLDKIEAAEELYATREGMDPAEHRARLAQLVPWFKSDGPKMKNFSLEIKTYLGASDEDSNPAIGKFRQLHEMLSWKSPDALTPVELRQHLLLFWWMFKRYLPKERYILALPVEWGGFGIPLGWSWETVPSYHRALIASREIDLGITSALIVREILAGLTRDRVMSRGVPVTISEEVYLHYLSWMIMTHDDEADLEDYRWIVSARSDLCEMAVVRYGNPRGYILPQLLGTSDRGPPAAVAKATRQAGWLPIEEAARLLARCEPGSSTPSSVFPAPHPGYDSLPMARRLAAMETACLVVSDNGDILPDPGPEGMPEAPQPAVHSGLWVRTRIEGHELVDRTDSVSLHFPNGMFTKPFEQGV